MNVITHDVFGANLQIVTNELHFLYQIIVDKKGVLYYYIIGVKETDCI